MAGRHEYDGHAAAGRHVYDVRAAAETMLCHIPQISSWVDFVATVLGNSSAI